MSFKTLARFGCAALLMTAVAGCGSKPVVGILLPRTGAASNYGASLESGIRVALAQARERHELPPNFDVVWADTQSKPAVAVAQLAKLVHKDHIKMVLGGATSAEARALLPELKKLNIVCLSPSASAPGLAKASPLFFRIYPSDELEGGRAGQFLYETLKVKRTLVFTDNSDYSRGIEPEFRRQYSKVMGGKIIGDVAVNKDGWQADAEKLLAKGKPDAVYVVGYAKQIVDILHFIRNQKYKGRIVTTSAFYTGNMIQKAGNVANGVFLPLPPFDRTSKDPLISQFVRRYMDTYERAPDIFAAHGYDAMRIVIKVMKIARPPETDEIKKALHFGISEFKGVTGPILFDDYGNVKHYPKMFIVANGQLRSYESYLKQEQARIRHQIMNILGQQ
ncbi:MAG: ABC transporter substrate-binding protein [Acidobacteria bacterium]|nr:ABC transporter substrate-binding protein [Acidobacteriota bacterium]